MRFILKILMALLAGRAARRRGVRGVIHRVARPRRASRWANRPRCRWRSKAGSPKNVPTPNVPGLQITQTGTSQNMSFINGAMSSTVTVTFSVTARQAGEFTIPALTADVNGQQLSTAPLKLTVTTASAPSAAAVNSGSEVAFLKFIFPKKKIYVGEPVGRRGSNFICATTCRISATSSSPVRPRMVSAPAKRPNCKTSAVACRSATTFTPSIPLAIPLTAVRTGALTLGPFTASAVSCCPSQNQGGDPFFRQFFNQGEQKQVTLATEPVNVESLPLPEENKPANFTGAVGNFTMTATAGPTNVTVGDPITVRVQISGRGALDSVTLPVQDAWQNFKTYPPTTKVETSDQFGFQGTKTFEQIISPLNTDVHEMPALTFSFFNPEDGQYHTLTQAAVPLTVKAAGATPLPQIAATKAGKSRRRTFCRSKKTSARLSKNPTSAGRAAGISRGANRAGAGVSRGVYLAQTCGQSGEKSAFAPPARLAQLVANGLNDLKKFAAENKSDEFFATLFRLLQEQLGERLDCPANGHHGKCRRGKLRVARRAGNTRKALREQFQLCNQARYAPVRGTGELNSVAAKFRKPLASCRR